MPEKGGRGRDADFSEIREAGRPVSRYQAHRPGKRSRERVHGRRRSPVPGRSLEHERTAGGVVDTTVHASEAALGRVGAAAGRRITQEPQSNEDEHGQTSEPL